MKKKNCFLVKIAALVVSARWAVKMKEHLPFCREFSILCTEIRAIVNYVA